MVTERVLDRQMAYQRQKNYVLKPEDFKKANEKSSERARNKIAAAVKSCLASGLQISRKTIENLSGCAKNTVVKHRDLWVKHSVGFLASGSSDLSLGGLEGSVLSGDIFVFVQSKKGESLVATACQLVKSKRYPSSYSPEKNQSSCTEMSEKRNSNIPKDFRAPVWLFGKHGKQISRTLETASDLVVDNFRVIPLGARRSILCHFEYLLSQEIYLGQLTPCADRSKGEGEQLNGKRHSSLMPPSKHLSIATGSIAGAHFVCLSVSTCGINGQPPHASWVPSHLILGNFCCGALRSLLLSLWRNKAVAANCFIGAQYANLTANDREPGRSRAPPMGSRSLFKRVVWVWFLILAAKSRTPIFWIPKARFVVQDKENTSQASKRPYIFVYRRYHFFVDSPLDVIETAIQICVCVYRYFLVYPPSPKAG